MQSEEDWDDGDDWDDDYDDSESSSFLDMELATKMKIAGVLGVALLVVMSSMVLQTLIILWCRFCISFN